jgi:hypothetical protein
LGALVGIVVVLFDVIKVNPDAEFGPALFFLTVGFAWACSLWFMTRFSVAAAAWQAEGLTVGKALKRSWRLSKGCGWRVFSSWLLAAGLGAAAAGAVSWVLLLMRSRCFDGEMIFRIKMIAIFGWKPGCVPVPVVQSARLLADTLLGVLIGPIFPIAATLIYYDQRIRKEGYDIERMMDAAGLNARAPDAAAVADSAGAGV